MAVLFHQDPVLRVTDRPAQRLDVTKRERFLDVEAGIQYLDNAMPVHFSITVRLDKAVQPGTVTAYSP